MEKSIVKNAMGKVKLKKNVLIVKEVDENFSNYEWQAIKKQYTTMGYTGKTYAPRPQ